jgi:hypothetical protein
MLNIGTRVVIDPTKATGTVVGFANYQSAHSGYIEPAYIVRLDQGVWTEDRGAFIDTLVVHYANAEELQ